MGKLTQTKMMKNCKQCNKKYESKQVRTSFCSHRCYWDSLKGKTVFIGGHTGKKHTEEYKKLMSSIMQGRKSSICGEKHFAWKGDDVKYRALHHWVVRQLGQPIKCLDCGKIGYGHQIHWANISGEYKRDINDWTRLCVKCHKAFDRLSV